MGNVYLDHNATTPMSPEVLEAMLPFYRDCFGNPSSVHSLGRQARVKVDEAREQVAALIGAQPGEIIFTSGGTESNNFAILGTALALRDRGKHIITCEIEHAAVLNPCIQLEALGFKVDRLAVDENGSIRLQDLKRHLTPETILITLQHANSEVGTLQEIDKIGEMAAERGILFHTDAIQSVGKVALDVREFAVDLLSVSAHKLCGPKGVGALFMRKGTPPLYSPVCGGNQEKKRRGGTENVAGIVGFAKACELARDRLQKGRNLEKLRQRLLTNIRNCIAGVEVFGHPERRLHNTLGLGFEGADGESLLVGLDMEGVAVSTGSACSSGSGLPSHVLTAMQIPPDRINSSLRFSLGWSNTLEEMDSVAKILERLVRLNRQKTLAF